jgi:hypothetical protein
VRPAAATLAAILLAAPARARPPEFVRWQDAADHVGHVVTVEGAVASARVAGGACTLEFAPEDPTALRVVLVLGLFSSPAEPERLYGGRRVHASGRVQSFHGRPEMIIRRADQIELVDDASTTSLPPSAEPPAAVPPPVAPSAPPSVVPMGDARRPPRADCARARDRIDVARGELAARVEDAARCLRVGTTRCQAERDAVATTLGALSAREAEADRACE